MGSSKRSESHGDSGFDLAAFTRCLAHELGNPLNAITLNAEATKLLVARNDAQRAAERLTALVADCARCVRLLQGIRRFGAGIGAGNADRERTSIAALVDAARSLLDEEGSKAPAAVEIVGSAATLPADRIALARAFAELLRNSVEAGATSVRVVVGEDDGDVTVDFFDDGAGIAPQLSDKVMQPFFSTRRNEGNAGLGLTLAQELVRTNGGTLEVGMGGVRGACMRVRFAPAQANI